MEHIKYNPFKKAASLGKRILNSPAPSLAAFLAGPFVMYTVVERLNSNLPWSHFSGTQILMNLIWYYMIFYAVYLAVGRLKLSAGISAVFFYIVGVANHYVYAFRGRTIFPSDLFTLRTAFNVAGSYDYTPDRAIMTMGAVVLTYLIVLVLLPRWKGRRMPALPAAISIAGAFVIYTILFFFTGLLDAAGIEPSMWTTRGNGFVLNFTVNIRYGKGQAPEGYSEDSVDIIASQVPEESPAEVDTPVNIIVVMNESFADLGVLGELDANQDWMPYYRGLTENCVKGWAYASVFGGTTANSEFEFLTGNTMAFLPAGTVPYQLYIDDDTPSLAQQLKSLGYKTVAMHPYLPSGWNRVPVYEYFCFDTVMFKDDFKNRRFMRNYVTDRSNYENVIDVYEEKEDGEPLFIFNITMQNHSAYNVEYRGLPATTWLTGELEGAYPTVDQFLSLMKESDSALEYFIDYFSRAEEPTMILFFGDHQPQVDPLFFEHMLGGSLDTRPTEQLQLRQMVPFFIWTNYDSPEEDGLELSMNYLGALLMERAGLPMTEYQRFQLELMESVPVINTVGFMDAQGVHYSADSILPDALENGINDYRILQYSCMFDAGARPENFFCLPD